MRRRLLWTTGGVALAGGALYRALRRRARPASDAGGLPDPRAAELRRKLDESRAIVEERDEFEAAETPVDRADPGSAGVDERRRAVHEQGRAAIDEMGSAGSDR